MTKIRAVMMTEEQLMMLVGILLMIAEGAKERGRFDLADPLMDLLAHLRPQPVTPIEA